MEMRQLLGYMFFFGGGTSGAAICLGRDGGRWDCFGLREGMVGLPREYLWSGGRCGLSFLI